MVKRLLIAIVFAYGAHTFPAVAGQAVSSEDPTLEGRAKLFDKGDAKEAADRVNAACADLRARAARQWW